MSFWSRIANVIRPSKLDREIDEEMRSHLEEAIEQGRDPGEARRAFGSTLRLREQSRDVKVAAWLESLRADFSFGARQLLKNRLTAGAAIVSLGLAIGACTAAFRLIDAVLWRPLSVANHDRLYYVSHEYTDRSGKKDYDDGFEYPLFRMMRTAVQDAAELIAISYSGKQDITFGSDDEMEIAAQQYVDGRMFSAFGLKPAAGRLLAPADDVKPGGHPYAVLSYEYWTRRFGRDPKVIGRSLRIGETSYQIIGVVEQGFTGTEPGTLTDFYLPMMANSRSIENPNWSWFRIWAKLRGGAPPDALRDKLRAVMAGYRRDVSKHWINEMPKERIEAYVNAPLVIRRAGAGVSQLQKNYRQSLTILGGVVALVLLIACANVANLMTAQAGARAREMALRVSIGAGRWRLVQMVLAESAILGTAGSLLGAVFAWWSVPFVVGMINPAGDPVRLILPADWRVLGFASVLAVAVTLLFGLTPALRASAVKPISALKGGEDPHSRRRLMYGLVAAQVGFCFVVHFTAGLFVATFQRLSNQPTGFNPDRVVILETSTRRDAAPAHWQQIADRLKSMEGVESVAVCAWPPLYGYSWTMPIWVNGQSPSGDNPYVYTASPGWFETMRVGMIAGRDFRPDDAFPDVVVVNEAFARHYFDGQNPVGRSFETMANKKKVASLIIGYVKNAKYRSMREVFRPTIYVPVNQRDEKTGGLRAHGRGSFIVRTASDDPLVFAADLRKAVHQERSEFRVNNIRTQADFVRQHTLRERLLAVLSVFFAALALLLSGVGLYGVLNYFVLQRRREIGIRMALGARAGHVAGHMLVEVLGMLTVGAATGLLAGMALEQYLATLLYQVKATDTVIIAAPALALLSAAIAASVPPLIRAVRIDPALTLRAE